MEADTTQELISELTTSAFKGDFPSIPLPASMDTQELGGMFITLPVAKVGAKSRNGHTYTREAVQAIGDQINAKKPEGRWGHLRPDERATRYDAPAVRWLASELAEDGTLWAKGVPMTSDAKEHFRVAKAAGAAVGVSVYGMGTFKGQSVVGFDVESIDLADPARVGLLEAVSLPNITAEMSEVTQENETVTQEIVQEMEGYKAQIAELTGTVNTQQALIGELLQVAGVEKPEELKAVVAEFIAKRDEAITNARKAVAELVIAELKLPLTAKHVAKALGVPTTDDKEAIKTRVAEIMQDPDIQAIAEMERVKMMGPNAVAGNGQNPKAWRDEMIQNADSIASKSGIPLK